jgi:hypothetical protein
MAMKFGAYGKICSTAFVTSIAHSICHRLSSASLFKNLAIEPFDTYIVVFFDGQAMSPECH